MKQIQKVKAYNVFLDFIRSPQDITYLPYNSIYYMEEFSIARSYIEFTEVISEARLNNKQITMFSLSHDLSENKFKEKDQYVYDNLEKYTGYQCLMHLLKLASDRQLIIKRNSINLHSTNKIGFNNMLELIKSADVEFLARITPEDKLISYV